MNRPRPFSRGAQSQETSTMKGACIAFLLATTALAASSGRNDVGQPEYDVYGIEDLILSAIEDLRSQLKQGVPEKNIPPLDPMDIKHQDISVSLNDTLRLNGSVSNVSGSNLLSFNITQLKAKISPIYLEIRLDWGAIDVKGFYDIDGHLLSIIPVYGSGKFTGYSDGAFGYLKLEIGSKAGELRLKKFDVDFGISNITVSIENFLGGLLGDIICEMINENAPTMIEQFKMGYLPGIKEAVIRETNNYLKGKSIDEILDFILGFLQKTTPAPEVTSTTAAN